MVLGDNIEAGFRILVTIVGVIGVCLVAGVVFTALKLFNQIEWPWLWVTCPFWWPIPLCGLLWVVQKVFKT